MAERPIIFSGRMVRAILEGRKTQTRRVARFASDETPVEWPCAAPVACEHCGSTSGRRCQAPSAGQVHLHRANGFNWHNADCPYGAPGNTLWVRESFFVNHIEHVRGALPKTRPVDAPAGRPAELLYRADGDFADHFEQVDNPDAAVWRPSIHMPRWASRITLRVTAVRVERLGKLSDSDARAEGLTRGDVNNHGGPVPAFAVLWDTINGERAPWASNPWVWVVSFEVLR